MHLATLGFTLYHGENDFGDQFEVMHANVPLNRYEYLRQNGGGSRRNPAPLDSIYRSIGSVLHELDHPVRFIVCSLEQDAPTTGWENNLAQSIGVHSSNQAMFRIPKRPIYEHEQLHFRSRTEIKMYQRLIARGLLVFPLPVAVLGQPNTYREPDFLVIYKGKAGILEINGDKWHPPQTAAKDHDRRRLFVSRGIPVYEIFDDKRCWNDPDGVIDEFLKMFDDH